ncbi:ATP-binding protein [Streptomyces stelliscabiei]|uniref:ATP-binding protein n=1 Tax=Streptomyces stelliscabiei TaxID=146820 RepID=UPI003A8F06EB
MTPSPGPPPRWRPPATPCSKPCCPPGRPTTSPCSWPGPAASVRARSPPGPGGRTRRRGQGQGPRHPQLGDWGLAELEFTAELVVSELVTNAIRYGRPPIRLRLIRDRTLLCEVSDSGGTTPHLRRARVFDEGGRGLLLVAQLAEHWGTRRVRRARRSGPS